MGLDEFIAKNGWIYNILYSFLAIIIAILVYTLITNIILRKIESNKEVLQKKKNLATYIKLFKSISRYLCIFVLILVLLKINGVNITSIVTGVGILGIIFGLVIQDAMKDIIKGLDIITDSYYKVGDVVRIDKYTGKVIAIGLKTTKLEDVYEKNIVSISNRNIEKVEVLSHMINIDLPLPYDLSLKKAEKTIEYIVDNIKIIKDVEKVEYRGVNDFADSSIKYQIKVYCSPINKIQIRRDALTCILRCLEEKNIHIPFNQIDVHQK